MTTTIFMDVYLKEIGVQTPVSSFLVSANEKSTQQDEPPISSLGSTVSYDSVITKVSQESKVFNMVIEAAEPASTPAIPPSIVAPLISTPAIVRPLSVEPDSGQASDMKEPAVQTVQIQPSKFTPASDLAALKQQVDACQACDLAGSRNQVVFGAGNEHADLVFIGDSPGRDEDVAGLPFTGRDGELFDRMLASISLNRDDVYMMNGVKCRPEHGRAAKPCEFASCEQWLVNQLDMLQPRLICMLGRIVAQTMLKSEKALSELRAGQFDFRGIPVVVIDHPSYLLRSQNHKRRAWQDLNKLKLLYEGLLG